MTYAEALNSLESYLQNLDSTISFETWMAAVGEQLSLIYGNGSVQHRNFLSVKNDFDTSKTGLTDPVKYRINEKNFRLRAKSHLSSLVISLKEAEQLAIREAKRKKKEAEEQRLRQQKEAEERRLQQEWETQKLREQLSVASKHKEEDTPKKTSRAAKFLPWIMMPIVAAALFYGGYAVSNTMNEKENLRLFNENKTLKQKVYNLMDSLQLQKQVVNQRVDSTSAK